SDAITIANLVSGTGALTQAGTGTTILTGANTYSGTTTINAGILQIGNGGATGSLGTGNVTDNGTLARNRTSTLTTANQVPGPPAPSAPPDLRDALPIRSDTITIANPISGTGALTQAGTGTTILTGANTYSGTTTISAGALQVGNGGTTGSLGTGNVTDNGTLTFNRSDSIAVGNTISGNGSLSQAGTGTTTLSAANTFIGTTTISAGTLRATTSANA